nr:hypothetical protein [Tanacetum cinerariifolium]
MAKTMEKYISKTRADYGSGVARPKTENKDNFELKGQFLKELWTNTFTSNANEHIEKVLEIVDLFHILNIPIDQVMLRAFLMSLTRAASHRLRNEPTASIITWDGLKIKFLNKYFPPAQTVKKMEEINNFKQEPNENLYQAWEQFKELLMKCPQYYLTKMEEVILFYNVLGIPTRQILDSRGTIPSKTAADVKIAIQEMAKYSYKWQGASFSVMPLLTYLNLVLGELAHIKLIVELADRTVKYPKGIAKNVLVRIGKFVFPVDFIILDMPEDIKVPLIIGRPFLSTAHAKLIKRVYMLSLRERIEPYLEARLMGETLVLNRSLDPFFKDYIKLNYLNEPIKLRRNQGDDLMPTIEEGKAIKEFRTRDDELDDRINDYPNYYDYDKKIHLECAHNIKFSCMIGFEFTYANFFPLLYVIVMFIKFNNSIMKDMIMYKGNNVVGVLMNVPIFVGTFFAVTDFAVLENMDDYRDEGMGDVIFGKPFLRDVGIKIRRFEGMITIYNGNDDVTYQVVRSYPRFKFHTNEQCNKIPPLLKIKKEYNNAITSQQNRVTEGKNRTLIEAARTMLANSFLPNTFWAKVVSTACYVLNRVLVTKPQNKTPYELITGKIPIISYIKPFGCHVTILNIIDHLGKFEEKYDKGFLIGYSLNSKAFRVYNLETKRVEENLHINFLENKPNVIGKGPTWLFDIDYLTDSMNYQPVTAENKANKIARPKEANNSAGTQDNINAGNSEMEAEHVQEYFVLPLWSSYTSIIKSSEAKNGDQKLNGDIGSKKNKEPVDQDDQAFLEELERLKRQAKEADDAAKTLRKMFAQGTDDLLLQARVARASSTNYVNTASTPVNTTSTPANTASTPLNTASPLRNVSATGPSYPNLLTYTNQDDSQIPNLKDICEVPNDGIFTSASYDAEGAVADFINLESTMNGYRQEEGIDYDEVFTHVARIEAIRIFLAFSFYMGFIVYQMDVKSAFLYGKINEEVYVSQPPGFIDPKFSKKVYKVVKALYGLHQALRAWYATLSTFLVKSGYRRRIIDKTLFIKKEKKDIMLVKQREDGIFISQDKYVVEILKKFDFMSLKTAGTSIETKKPLVKDAESANVDVHLYRSMIGSLMYLTASRPDIMYLKGQPKLGIWYPKESAFDLEDYSNSDYAEANLDKKSTTGVKKPVFHSKTKHIEIRHHFIRDAYEKKLIQTFYHAFIHFGLVSLKMRSLGKEHVSKQRGKKGKGADYAMNEERSTDKIKVLNAKAEGVSVTGEILSTATLAVSTARV